MYDKFIDMYFDASKPYSFFQKSAYTCLPPPPPRTVTEPLREHETSCVCIASYIPVQKDKL